MTNYSKESLLKMEHPYEFLIKDGDSMLESDEGLEQLSRKEKLSLATKMVLQCPLNELDGFKSKIQNLALLQTSTAKGLHTLILQALQVRMNIEALVDPKNTEPYQLLLDRFDDDLFNQFQHLSHSLVNEKATLLATALTKDINKEQAHALIAKLRMVFSNTPFLAAMGQALLLRQQLELLKGESPYEVLRSAEFNVDLLHKFHVLVASHLAPETEEIAKKLATAPREELSRIGRDLEGLTRAS